MKLSVIIPSYNRADLVALSITSICRIAHRPLEIVVVDDGSTDETPAKETEIRALCRLNNVDLQWIRQANAGAAAARNRGFHASNGDFVQWVDADDTVEAGGVSALLTTLMQRADVDVAYGLVSVVAPDGGVEGVMGKPPSMTYADYFDYLWHTMGAVFRRSSVKIKGPWNPKLTMPDDWDFSSRMRISGVRIAFVNVIVGKYQKYETGTLTITGFNEAKCFNVIDAVLSIRAALLEYRKLTPYLQQRCYNRALVHAVELSVHGSRLAPRAYEICREIGSPSVPLGLLRGALEVFPLKAFHRCVFRALRSK